MNTIPSSLQHAAHAAARPFELALPPSTTAELIAAAAKDLESQDRLGNFEIQDLMSRYNQAAGLSSNVQRKLDDTHRGVIGKIG